MDAAFEFFVKIEAPFWAFHDRDIAPEGATLAESNRNLDAIVAHAKGLQQATGIKLLWGTANLFSNPRYMCGAATNPDAHVFAYAAAQVKKAMEVTHELGGDGYTFWGGREGYETLLNTNLKREQEHLARFLHMAVDHAKKIGFKGQFYIEPKPKEPTKHQYDFDVATCFAFLQRYDLTRDVKLNLEQNHAILAGHSFQHEIALANALDVFGSLDINRGDDLLGWDTDQFAMNVPEMALCFHELLRAGGFSSGGLNFDAKIRRQSIDPDDLIHAHAGSMDACARAFIAAADMLEAGTLTVPLAERYAGWRSPEAEAVLAGQRSLADIADRVLAEDINPQPRSGRQEYLEALVNRFV
jgi:xylose isomerase